ncbi:MAG TPA: ATP-binding protein [Gemmatimonadaceae bacterium]|nr:ATP-binding protein [Gemmatimonadaceae bacterium]
MATMHNVSPGSERRRARILERSDPVPGWMRQLPLVTGLLLAALLIVPLWLRQHTSHLRARVTDVALPARNALLEVQIAFASEVAAIRGFELTGDTAFLNDFGDGVNKDRVASERLLKLAAQLGPEAGAAVFELDGLKQAWLQEPNEALAGRRTREQLIQSLDEGERRVDGVLTAADKANSAVIAAETEMRRTLTGDERTAALLVSILALAALGVIIVVGWLVHRLNLLADELRYGVEEEASLHHVAGTLNSAPTVEEVAQQVTTSAMNWTRSSGCFLERRVGDVAEIVAARGTDAPAPGSSIPFGESATARAMNGTAVSDGERAHAVIADLGDPLVTRKSKALVVPLVVDGDFFGSLVLNRGSTPSTYTERDTAYAVALGDLVTAALGRVLLIEREQHARTEAEDAVHYRDRMLRVVSHDLKNPLHTIGMSADLLSTVELPENQKQEQFRIIMRTVERMNRLIHDLLDAARVQSGRALAVSQSVIDTREFLTEATDQLAAEARAKKIRLDCDADSAPPTLFADRDRLLQVFSNLLGNAVKFTGEGGRIAVLAAPSESGGTLFSVCDTGPGIAAEEIPHLFEPFWQAGDSARLGTGLGLSIARGIVEAHGGTISVRSVPGEGTTFEFDLPPAPG